MWKRFWRVAVLIAATPAFWSSASDAQTADGASAGAASDSPQVIVDGPPPAEAAAAIDASEAPPAPIGETSAIGPASSQPPAGSAAPAREAGALAVTEAEPVAAPSAESVAQLVDAACFEPFGDLIGAAEAFEAAGLTRDRAESGLLLYSGDGVAALLASKDVDLGGRFGVYVQCTVVSAGPEATDVNAALDVVLAERDLALRSGRLVKGAVLRDFGSKGVGYSMPPRGTLILLSPEIASAILEGAAGGVSVIARPPLF